MEETNQTQGQSNLEKSTSEADFAQMWQGLSHNQQRFAVAMLDAVSKKEAAIAVGLEPNTVYGWNGDVDAVVAFMRGQACESALEILVNKVVKAAMVKIAALDSADEKTRQDVATEVLDRVLGRAKQSVKHEGTGDGGALLVEYVNDWRIPIPDES